MEDAVYALHRPAHGPPVGDVAAGALEVEVHRWSRLRSARAEQPQLVAALRERADDVRAEESGASGDEGLAHERTGW